MICRLNTYNTLFVFGIFLFIFNCTKQTQFKIEPHIIQKNRLKSFEVKEIKEHYISNCKINIKRFNEIKSGNCDLYITQNALRLDIFDPFGRMMVEILILESTLLVIHHYNQTFLKVPNNPKNRIQAIGFDLNFIDFQSIFWGRKIISSNNLIFSFKNQKPYQVTKETKAQNLVITYKKWSISNGIEIPKIIQIKDSLEKNNLTFVALKLISGKVTGISTFIIPKEYTALKL